ncbi:MAG: hypothetical protein M3Y45_09625 [Actinomycetota bacterium]|nr:hypothetical protein [Actinomycetota bacterium]
MGDGYFDLGTHSRPASTGSVDAQTWFDRGLVWTYAFNHEEAVRCFDRAIEADDGFALAYWGGAYAIGPNYNKEWDAFDEPDLFRSLDRAVELLTEVKPHLEGASPVERALIGALSRRYQGTELPEDPTRWNDDYVEAMRDVYREYPDDLDVATLFADALMNVTPWALWDSRTGEPADGAHTVEAREVLERGMARPGGMEHPGLLHMYLHLIEMSGEPEAGLEAADRLRTLVPDAGHLLHMPSHIDVLVGDYRRVVEANSAAIAADQKYFDRVGGLNFYSLYRSHDFHFRIYGAMFLGQSQVALESSEALVAALPPELLRIESPPMADWLEGFVPMRMHVLIRFGMWDEILATPLPVDRGLYCVTTAMIRYARGVALAATGRIEESEREREEFLAAWDAVPETRAVFNNICRDVLAIASSMLDGELEYRKQNYDAAFDHLRRSIELDDNLPYDEPWGWMQPTRHAYGALLLEQGHVKEAAAAYAADLGLDETLPRSSRHPDNVWSLHGYYECLHKLGETEAARVIKPRLDVAIARADAPIKASCFCRLSAAA